jgi:uncharacterized protein YndB with AHSA1/START domain
MPETLENLENLTLNITQEIHVDASIETTFAALVEQLSAANEHPDGTRMPMKLELWPGGRWFRDLGGDNGHWWGAVQAIKRPTLLEISGPLFMSYPAANNVQYRLSESKGGTLIQFHHTSLGLIPEDHRKHVNGGWLHILEQARNHAEEKR